MIIIMNMIMMRVEYTDYLADCGSNHDSNNSNDGNDDNNDNDSGEKRILTINRR